MAFYLANSCAISLPAFLFHKLIKFKVNNFLALLNDSQHIHNQLQIGNNCRNPKLRRRTDYKTGQAKDRPWCFTTDPNIAWEYCDIPFCGKYCKICFARSLDFSTENGRVSQVAKGDVE